MNVPANTDIQYQKHALLTLTRVRFISLILISTLLGGAIGWALAAKTYVQLATATQNRALREGGYTFIHPLLLTPDSSVQSNALSTLKNKIYQGTFELLNDPEVRTLSVYFRDLTTSHWTGVREDEIYDSASLLKVPLLIAYLKKSESDPLLFSKKILYRGEQQDNKNVEFYTLKPGTTYTVEELIHAMIVESDNSAKDLLFDYLDKNFQNKVFSDLGLAIPNPNEQYQISPKIYSLFFRLLYNATYLTREDSEKALDLLSKSDYKDGLVAGVPPMVAITHKFGQYGSPAANGTDATEWQLHDCGIVYHPDVPYLLCVMTRGENLDKLSKLIRTVSQITYQETNNNFQ